MRSAASSTSIRKGIGEVVLVGERGSDEAGIDQLELDAEAVEIEFQRLGVRFIRAALLAP